MGQLCGDGAANGLEQDISTQAGPAPGATASPAQPPGSEDSGPGRDRVPELQLKAATGLGWLAPDPTALLRAVSLASGMVLGCADPELTLSTHNQTLLETHV